MGKIRKKKKHTAAIMAAGAALLLAGAAGAVVYSRPVAYINGIAVPKEEMQIYMEDSRAEAAAYYTSNYGVDFGIEGAWDEKHDGKSAKEYLAELALDKLTKAKLTAVEAERLGYDIPVTYKELQKALKEENEDRAEKSASGKVIYGPEEFGEMEYITYLLGNAQNEIESYLIEKEKLSDEDLKKLYSDMDPGLFDNGYDGQIDYYYLSDADKELPQETKEAIFTQIVQTLNKDPDHSEVIAECAAEYGINPEYQSVEVSTRSMKGEDVLALEIYHEMREVDQGGCKAVERDGQTVAVLYMREKYDYGTMDFEEAKESVKMQWEEDAFENWLEEQAGKADVEKSSLFWWKVKV